ncbi:MAG: hypothetical protein GY942_15180, partial [Aestuariibacter sp.]|nr:hypothetical protein [Aestuariibacter sp.]
QSITSIKYLDSDGAEQTLATSEYELDTHADTHKIVLAYNTAWPTARSHTNSIKIRFVAGWGLAAAVPEDIKTALLLAVGHWIRFQAVAESGIGPTRLPYQFYDLLRRYRQIRL